MKKKIEVKKPAAKKAVPMKVVTKKWLLGFADKIYNPKTRKFTPLCAGTLCETDDETGYVKPGALHCGLGELYYAMTGKDPEPCKTSEDEVIELAMSLSTLNQSVVERENVAKLQKVANFLKKQKVFSEVENNLLDEIQNAQQAVQHGDIAERTFSDLLNEIPRVNDDYKGKHRSKEVAKVLREAALLLK